MSEQKTHDEIIEEMRFHGQLNIDEEKDNPEFGILTMEGRITQYYAAELAAAHKRELEVKESVIQTLAAEIQAERANTVKLIGVLESANEHASKIMAITTVPELYATNMDAVRHHAVEIGFHAAEAVSEIKAEVNE